VTQQVHITCDAVTQQVHITCLIYKKTEEKPDGRYKEGHERKKPK